MEPLLVEPIDHRLDPRLVSQWRKRVWDGMGGFARISLYASMHPIDLLGLRIIRLQFSI
jgi:hypothetical protein